MPVEKFKSVEEMDTVPFRTHDYDAFARFARHCARFKLISGRKNPRGVVFRFRSLDEAQATRGTVNGN